MMKGKLVNKKKVLIVLNELGIGGAEVSMVELANHFVKKFDVTILTLNDKNELGDKLNKSTRTITFQSTRIRQTFFQAFRFFIKNDFDIILLNLWPITSFYSIIVRISNFIKPRKVTCKLLVIEHSVLSEQYKFFNSLKRKLMILFIRSSYNMANKVLCVSKGIKNELLSYGVDSKKLKVIYNPLIINDRQPKLSKSQKNMINSWLSVGSVKLITVGNLKKQKNHIFMLKTLSMLPTNYKLLIVGSGPLFQDLKKEIKKLGISNRVFLLGRLNNPSELLKESDLYISSSISESFGMSILEALFHGKTVISNNCPYGPKEILGESYPYLINDLNHDDFKKIIHAAASKPLDPSTLKEKTKIFSLENYIDAMHSVL